MDTKTGNELNQDALESVSGGGSSLNDDRPYQISMECVECGVCAAECPLDCIHPGEGYYVIDESVCAGCGFCEMSCPIGAIYRK